MKRPAKQEQTQTQIRMSEALRARVRKYQERMQRGGIAVSFSSAARTLVDIGLRKEGL